MCVIGQRIISPGSPVKFDGRLPSRVPGGYGMRCIRDDMNDAGEKWWGDGEFLNKGLLSRKFQFRDRYIFHTFGRRG